MSISLKGRNFITLKDYSPEEITYLLDLAEQKKIDKKNGKLGNSLKGKNIALIFEKPSTRTRCAFVVGSRDEAGMKVASRSIWGRMTSSWATRRASRTPPASWAGCLTGSSSADSCSQRWKTWQNTPVSRSGTA